VQRDVAYYSQSLDFTCGPASLLMALHHFDPAIPLDRASELELWREANMVESYGTSSYGLAWAAHRRGFSPTLINSHEGLPLRDTILDRFPDADPELLELFFTDLEARCRRAGIANEIRPLTLDDVRDALDRGDLPIVLTSTRVGVPDEHIPHWILVTGWERDGFAVRNPYVEAGHPADWLPEAVLTANLGYEGEQSLVTVGSRPAADR